MRNIKTKGFACAVLATMAVWFLPTYPAEAASVRTSQSSLRKIESAYLKYVAKLYSPDIEVRYARLKFLNEKIWSAAAKRPKNAVLSHLKELDAYHFAALEEEVALDRKARSSVAPMAKSSVPTAWTQAPRQPSATPVQQPVTRPAVTSVPVAAPTAPPSQGVQKASGIRLSELKSKAAASFEFKRHDDPANPLRFPSWYREAYRDSTYMAYWFNFRKAIEEDPAVSEELLRKNGADLSKPYYVFEFRSSSMGVGGASLGQLRSVGVVNVDALVTAEEIRAAAQTRYFEDRADRSSSSFLTNVPELSGLSDPYAEKHAGPHWKRLLLASVGADGKQGSFGILDSGAETAHSSFSDDPSILSEPTFFSAEQLRRAKDGILYERREREGWKYRYAAFVSHGKAVATGNVATIRKMAEPEYSFIRDNISRPKDLSIIPRYNLQSPLYDLYYEVTDLSGAIDPAKIASYRELKTEVDRIVSGKASDDEKVRAVFDWIRKNVRYDDYTNSIYMKASSFEEFDRLKEKQNPEVHSGIRTYVNREGVCSGFSNLFYIMLGMAGVSDREVLGGKTLGGSVSPWHAWNRVGSYYYDVTWGDKWFRLTKEQMYRDRIGW